MVLVLPVASTVTCVLSGGEVEDDAVTQENIFHFYTHISTHIGSSRLRKPQVNMQQPRGLEKYIHTNSL